MSIGVLNANMSTPCAYEGVNGVTLASLNFVPSSLSPLHQVLRQVF
jgi:hypothetical protein